MIPRITHHLMSIIGAILTVAGFLALITSHTLKIWIKTHSYWVFVALILCILIAFVVIDYVRGPKRKEPTKHDREMVSRVLKKVPPDSGPMVWLKERFISKQMPVKYLDILDEVSEQMSRNILGLDNASANSAYATLRDAIEEFHHAACYNLFTSADYETVERSQEWSWEQWEKASEQIKQSRTALVKAYDEFLNVCHRNHLC